MGEYTTEYRAANMAIGNTAERGNAWWATRDEYRDLHFPGSIPLDVAERLIGWKPIQVPMMYVDPTTGMALPYGSTDDTTGEYDGPMVVLRPDFGPIGYNAGATNHISYWDWFIKGPKTLLDVPELNLGFVGLFKNGAVAAVQIELAKTITDSYTGVGFRPFLYASTALDGSMRPQMGTGHTRIVCENTFAMAKSEARGSGAFYSLKQTKNRQINWNEARAALDIVHADSDALMAEFRELADTVVTDRQWFAFLDEFTPLPQKDTKTRTGGRSYTMATKKRDILQDLWNNDVRVATWRNTALGVSQAVTTYSQNMSIVRNTTRVERNKLDMIQGKASLEETTALQTLKKILTNA
jgi:phage/plasmid-like protein (TIGR03299 family)